MFLMKSSFDFRFIILLLNAIFCIANESRQTQSTLGNANITMAMASPAKKLFGIEFEVFGKVQGVFFRKHTEKKAKELHLKGWCLNTPAGTVRGCLEGPKDDLESMKSFLQNVGSPKSRIDKATFTEMQELKEYTYKGFVIRR